MIWLKHHCGETNHRFQPRYDEVPTGNLELESESGMSPKEARSLVLRNVYVQDVCVFCGKVVKRK